MRFSRQAEIGLLGLSALTREGVQADDVLYSRSLARRGLDAEGNFNISFFHINDVHAHLDEFSSSGTDCTRPERGCFGGYARVKTVIDDLRPQHNDSLWLNVGDEFQGTLFYSYYGGEKIAETLNELNFDAMTLGNHEFDAGEDELGDFLNNLTFPVISANIESVNEKVAKKIEKYHIFEKQGVAIIGVTTEDTPGIANPDDGTEFTSAVEAVQNAIDEIKAKTNITRIAAITHIGYDKDQELAAATSGLHLIMGAHSHTLLGDMEDAEGKYPTIVKNKDGDEVFIVTAYRWGEYLGSISVTYNPSGKILAYYGAPIHLTNSTEQEPELQTRIKAWRGPFEEFAAQVLGKSEVVLDQSTCQRQECLLGDFMADAMLDYRKDLSAEVDFALINAGGIRATIDEGDITRGEVLTSFPFGNAVVEIKIAGQKLWEVLEGVLTGVNVGNGKEVTSFIQVSKGIKIQYNPQNGNNSKLVSVSINDKPLDNGTDYTIVTLDFLAGGGDNIFDKTSNFTTLDTQDEVLVQYIEKESPVNVQLDGRIEVVNGTRQGGQPTMRASGSGNGEPASPAETGGVGRVGEDGLVGAGVLAVVMAVVFGL